VIPRDHNERAERVAYATAYTPLLVQTQHGSEYSMYGQTPEAALELHIVRSRITMWSVFDPEDMDNMTAYHRGPSGGLAWVHQGAAAWVESL
jgi:hypothetical protein